LNYYENLAELVGCRVRCSPKLSHTQGKENKSDFSLGFLIVIARENNKMLQVLIFPQKRNNIQIFKNVKSK